MITIFFRYDDYSSLSDENVDRGLIGIFQRHGLTCTFAVVPAVTVNYPAVQGENQGELPLGPEKLTELREAVESGAVDVALHGWRHLANEFHGHPEPSEFKGLSVDAQVQILRCGSDFLFQAVGIRPSVFVPPWNTYDDNTLLALDATGFKGVSANRYSPAPKGLSRLQCMPMTTEIRGLRRAIERARARRELEPVIGVMMHPYDFRESADRRAVISLPEFDQELEWLRRQDDVRVVAISTLAASVSMGRDRLLANSPSFLERSYPKFISRIGSDPVYHSEQLGQRERLRRDAAFAGTMFGVLIVGCLVGWFAARLHQPLADAIPFVAGAGLAIVILRAFRERAIYARGASLVAFLAGILLSSVVWAMQ